ATAGAALAAASAASGSTMFVITPSAVTTLSSAAAGTSGMVVFIGATYTDDFNRASLDGNWFSHGANPPVINTNKLQGGTTAATNTTTLYPVRYTTPVLGDKHRSGGVLVTPSGSTNVGLGVGLTVRGTTSGNRLEAVV